MKRLIPLILSLFSVAFMQACTKDSGIIVRNEPGPVVRYYCDAALVCKQVDKDILIGFTGSIVIFSRETETHQSLSLKHHDTSFTGTCDSAPFNMIYRNDLKGINIISDADFDGDHPRGTSLNDVFTYSTKTVYKWILSGYNSDQYYYNAIQKPVDQLVSEDMTMLAPYAVLIAHDYGLFALTPNKQPDKNLTQPLTITLVTDDDQEITFKLDFEFNI
ncbi:MAG: hypothetical protein J5699_08530 [Bacteroidales bacterium]|nr:hypothetical protein [Bacteroidales bacterium]